jgi:hypothetical protein
MITSILKSFKPNITRLDLSLNICLFILELFQFCFYLLDPSKIFLIQRHFNPHYGAPGGDRTPADWLKARCSTLELRALLVVIYAAGFLPAAWF